MSIFQDLVQHISALLGFISLKYAENVGKAVLQECAKGVERINKAIKKAT